MFTSVISIPIKEMCYGARKPIALNTIKEERCNAESITMACIYIRTITR